ncbi:MAG: cysteine desulfurase [Paludibacteraceae bacterium]|nr:cysteine desulfurase [Paludibacteraceae bacterium]
MNRNDFPILAKKINNKPFIYFDNAATAQKPQVVIDAIQFAYENCNANIHRGVYYLSNLATQNHEWAREKVASFFGAKSKNEIIFTKGTTDGINTIAHLLEENKLIQKDDEIIISYMEHHSNIVPWQMLCERTGAKLKIIPLKSDLTLDFESFKSLINEHTKLVSIAQISNVLGICNPVDEIVKECKKKGILVCVDGAQSAPHKKVNLQELDCDFFVMSSHKMYGPTGLGVLYGKEELLQKMEPVWGGGEMIEKVTFEKTTYNKLPYRFEAGTPDFINTYAFGKAIEYVESIGIENIEKYEKELTQYAENKLKEIDEIKIYGQGVEKYGIVSFNVADIQPFDIGLLLDSKSIAIRTGHHCAEPLIDYLQVPGTARISFAFYNEKEEIDIFIKELKECVKMLK